MKKIKEYKSILIILTIVCVVMLGFFAKYISSCVKSEQSENVSNQKITCSVKKIDQFGSAVLDITTDEFLNNGFEYGDSVDIQYSDEKKILADIPFFDNFFGENGDAIVSGFDDDLSITGIASSFEKQSGIKEGDSVTIKLSYKGKYAQVQELYALPDPKERYDWQTDENFSNTRMITIGEIKPYRIYRGGSPFDPEYKRCKIVSDYIDQNNIQTIFNLADDMEKIASYDNLSKTALKLIENNQVKFEKMGVDYSSEETHLKIGDIFEQIANNDGPYLIHCSIGQDRTGFLCSVIEAFCGASYDEIVDDYMKSYENLYGFNESSNPEKYNCMKKRVDFMITVITGNENPSDMTDINIKNATWDYCRQAGVSENTLQEVYDRLTK